jgi:CDP-glucose 4,6-dehydratase
MGGMDAMNDESLSIYAGKRVLLTGHSGFKGGWLALWLSRLDADVTGYSLPPTTTPNLFEVASIARRVRSTFGDVRALDHLARVWSEARPDIVFHLAAQPIVRESYRTPLDTIQTNVIGTSHILETARREQRPVAVVLVTSDKCYENREWVFGYRETDRLGGRDPYSASKAAAELLVSSYRRSFFPPEALSGHGVAVATARAGNVIGGGDWAADRIVPDAIRALSRAESVAVRNPAATRPWQHVLEPLSGYLRLGARLLGPDPERAAACDAWNFGPDPADTRSVRDVVERVIAEYGGGRWHQDGDVGPHEFGLLQLATDRARVALGWKPRWRFAETIAATVGWYKAQLGGEQMDAWCERQIDEYCRS